MEKNKFKIQYEKLLDENKCIRALSDGFIEHFGKDKIEFFNKLAEELIPMGKKAGREFYHLYSISRMHSFSISMEFEKSEIERQQILMEMDIFFTKEEIRELINKKIKNTPHIYEYFKGYEKHVKLCKKELKENTLNIVTSKEWKYFKKFPIYADHKTVSIYGEGGLDLDFWKKENLEFYKDDLSYRYIEKIPDTYFRLGTILGRQELREELLPKIINNINDKTTNVVKRLIRDYIKDISPDSIEDDTLLYIQEITGLKDDFLTDKQISKRLNNWAKTKEGKQKLKELENLFKN